jgi:hypothetical protein
MRMTSPRQDWSKAFNHRFSEELESEDGIAEIIGGEVDAWLWELRQIAQYRDP